MKGGVYALMSFPLVEGDADLKYDDIVFIDTCGRKCIFHTVDGRVFQIYRKLGVLQKEFEKHGFIRCHRCYMINRHFAVSLKNYVITLSDGSTFSVSRARYGDVKEKLL